MKASLLSRLEQLLTRLAELDALLSEPELAERPDQLRKLSQERSEIEPVVAEYRHLRQTQDQLAQARALLDDPDLRDLARSEMEALEATIPTLEDRLQRLLLPRDPAEGLPVYLEIRAGTGGEESALFAGDLLRMYLRHAEQKGWRSEIVSESPSDLGGYREVIVRLEGDGVFGRLQFESGTHRVQRVPETEAQGRIHTSACTVAVLPEADVDETRSIPATDLRIDTFRASGAGGQHINKTDSAVRITHLPTGLVVECQDDRSQHRNRDKAMRVLLSRLQDMQRREAQAREAATRRSLVGSGDRSERIRTYNFPQGRLTDHRINLTLYRLQAVLDGDLDDISNALIAEHQAEQLARLADE